MQQQAHRNPARQRGLRRARAHRAPCEPVDRTPIPSPVDGPTLLALQTRVRLARIAGGELAASRRYDLRAYKSAAAEHAYLLRLAHAARNGTIATSMPQLVRGLARLHPSWTMDGDRFDDRDRHQTAVRRRLRDLDAMGVLRWRIGVDTDGEDARTELELRQAPDVTADELADARAQLARWRRRYGTALDTGSSTGIRHVSRRARPLSALEQERRGRAHTIARHRSRSNTAPLSEAPATPENHHRPSELSMSSLGERRDRRARASAGPPAWLAALEPSAAWPPPMGERTVDAIQRAAAPSDRAALSALRTAASSGGGFDRLRQAGAAGAPADIIALAGWALAFPGLEPRLSEANRLRLRRSGLQYDRLAGAGAAAALLIERLQAADLDAAQGLDPRTIVLYAADLKATSRALRRQRRGMPPPRPHRPRERE
jgi:hypothetical protein